MARITVEDCLENMDNIFKLVLVAARRARQISNSGESTRDATPTVAALRDIADNTVTEDILDQDDEFIQTD